EAAALLRQGKAALGGGTELLDRLKGGIAPPVELVDLSAVEALQRIEVDGQGLRVGAAVTLAELAADPRVQRHWRALARAAGEVATPPVRNMATLGGNLGQRPRCWYFRSPWFSCFKKGGGACYAVRGDGGEPYRGEPICVAVHPSSVAAALCALDAIVEIAGAQGVRRVAAADFWLPQEAAIAGETVLEPGELISGVWVPLVPGARSYYAKIRDRDSWDFVAVTAAATVTVAPDGRRSCTVYVCGLENRPWRAEPVESALAAHWGDAVEAVAAACRRAFAAAWSPARQAHPVKYRQAEALVGRLARMIAREM
ncbi:MAG TPA: FAD binding domain-containing protein, partial [Limnochordia bacterium]